MQWWKRLIFSIISLVFGYASINYLYYAFSKLINASGNAEMYKPQGDGVQQLIGGAMFVLYFFVVAAYFWLIKKASPHIDIIEKDKKTGKQRIKKKWFDIILQAAFILTGMILRWCYIMYIYIPALVK